MLGGDSHRITASSWIIGAVVRESLLPRAVRAATLVCLSAGCLGPGYTPRTDARLKRVCDFWSCRWEREGRQYSTWDLDVAVQDNPRAHAAASSSWKYKAWALVTSLSGGLCMGASLLWAAERERRDQDNLPALITVNACLAVATVGIFVGAKGRQLGADAVNIYNDDVVAE